MLNALFKYLHVHTHVHHHLVQTASLMEQCQLVPQECPSPTHPPIVQPVLQLALLSSQVISCGSPRPLRRIYGTYSSNPKNCVNYNLPVPEP